MAVADIPKEAFEEVASLDKPQYNILCPLFIALKATGIVRVEKRESSRFIQKLLWRTYNGLCLCIIWFSAVRVVLIQDLSGLFSPSLAIRIILLLWHFMAATYGTYFALFNGPRLHTFLTLWEKNCRRSPAVPYSKAITIIMAVGAVITAIPSAMGTWFVWGSDLLYGMSDAYSATPFPADADLPAIYRVFTNVVVVHSSIVIGLVMTAHIVICYILHKEMTYLSEDFKKAVEAVSYAETVDAYRLGHQALCRLIELANSILSVSVAVMLIVCSTAICLSAWVLVTNLGNDAMFLLTPSVSLLCHLGMMMLMIVSATIVNASVSAIDIYCIVPVQFSFLFISYS